MFHSLCVIGFPSTTATGFSASCASPRLSNSGSKMIRFIIPTILNESGVRMNKLGIAALAFSAVLVFGFGKIDPSKDARLKGASRRAESNGWIQVHLQGSPAQIGFQ